MNYGFFVVFGPAFKANQTRMDDMATKDFDSDTFQFIGFGDGTSGRMPHVDDYMKLGDIEGESYGPGPEDTLEPLSRTLGVESPRDVAQRGHGRGNHHRHGRHVLVTDRKQ